MRVLRGQLYFPKGEFELIKIFVSLGVRCCFNTFVSYCRFVCRALAVGRIVMRINAVS